jgi:hypothetical protein
MPSKQLFGDNVQPSTRHERETTVSQWVASVPAQSAALEQGWPAPSGGRRQKAGEAVVSHA